MQTRISVITALNVEWTMQIRWPGCIPWNRVHVAGLLLFFTIFSIRFESMP